jgi:hypothetical protein
LISTRTTVRVNELKWYNLPGYPNYLQKVAVEHCQFPMG